MEDKHIDSGVVPMGLSDHFATFTTISWKQRKIQNKHFIKRSRNYKSFKETLFLNDIATSAIFNKLFSYINVEDVWRIWKNEFNRICNKYAPIKSCRVRQTRNPWISEDILKLINRREFLHKKALATKQSKDFIEYRLARNKVTYTIKMAKKKFYTEKISLAQSQSEIWKTLKNILPSKQTDNLETDLCFDSVPHDKLLNKLSFYGIKGVEHCWFKSYLKKENRL